MRVISSNILEKCEFAANSESLIPFIAKSWVFSEIANPRSSCSMIDLDMGKDDEVFLRECIVEIYVLDIPVKSAANWGENESFRELTA